MRNGISAGPLPNIDLPYRDVFDTVCVSDPTFSPLLAYAIKVNETGKDLPPDTVSADGGHGLMQLTASYPDDWADPTSNVKYAKEFYLCPAEAYWAEQGMQGDNLVRCIAAEYNAGRGNAIAGHEHGNVDEYTTNNYAARCLEHYKALCAGRSPF